MALKFQKELPALPTRTRSTGPTEAHRAIAKECKANPGLWACLTEASGPTWRLVDFLPLKSLGIDVRTRGAGSEEYTASKGAKKGQKATRTLYHVWVAYNPPAPKAAQAAS